MCPHRDSGFCHGVSKCLRVGTQCPPHSFLGVLRYHSITSFKTDKKAGLLPSTEELTSGVE